MQFLIFKYTSIFFLKKGTGRCGAWHCTGNGGGERGDREQITK